MERIEFLYSIKVHQFLADLPDEILRRYAQQLSARSPAAGARIREPARTIEVAWFFRYCLLNITDQLILMVSRYVAELWREASDRTPQVVDWAYRYKHLLAELHRLFLTKSRSTLFGSSSQISSPMRRDKNLHGGRN